MSAILSSSTTTTTTATEVDAKRQRTDVTTDNNDVPPLDDLLVALDVAPRDEEAETENVILALIARAKLDGVPSRKYLAVALLIAFKRRNHAASQAQGMGAGERAMLRTVLAAISVHDPDAIKLVLPLVPLYGSWRDLLVLAEKLIPTLDHPADLAVEDIPVVSATCALFAEQLKADAAAAESVLPSSAAKYAPHEGRHQGKGKQTAAAKSKALADAIAKKLGLERENGDKHSLRAAYRRLRAALNKRLAEAGHLLEPLLAAKRLDAIQFAKAPKGALAKCRKAILKNPKAAERWKRAMARSTKAVPDLDDLVKAAAEALEEAREPDEAMKFMPRRIAKAIESLKEQRADLVSKAQALLEQLRSSEAPAACAEGDAAAEAIGALADGSSFPLLPVVLSNDCSGHVRHELLLAAFLLATAQELPCVAVDGELVNISDVAPAPASAPVAASDASSTAASAVDGAIAANAVAMPDFDGFLTRVGNARTLIAARRGTSRNERSRLLDGGKALLSTAGLTSGEGRRAGDVVAICSSFTSSSEPEELNRVVNLLKADGMRLLLVHRVREVVDAASGGAVDFCPRVGLRPMPSRGSETIDVCFVLDLTGSMGAWIDQCKSHIKSIINSLRDDLGVGTVRVSFCGYRDWGERNSADARRVVPVDFVPMHEVGRIVDVLRNEHAAGGGDGPEDVISAIEAVNSFAWRGDVRVCVFIADAPAHGFSSGGDDFPKGMCPDQHTPLPELITELATTHGVDLLCTRLAPTYTDKMYNMFAEQYPGGEGFGVLPIDRGAHTFKAAILGSLSAALCKLIAPAVDTPGVQTFDGQTVSALMATSNASLRESIDAAASLLRAPSAAAVAAAEAERDDVVAASAERVEALEVEVAAAEAALGTAAADADLGDGSDDEDGDAPGEAMTMLREELAAAKSALEAAKTMPKVGRAARGDAARLHAALESEELHPVRLALGLPLPSESLALDAATALLRAGVCVADLEEKGYPDTFVKAMREAAATLARRV